MGMKNIFLFGASGHASVVLDILRLTQQYKVSYFLDDNKSLHGKEFMGIPVLGGSDRDLLNSGQLFGMQALICIGDNKNRHAAFDLVKLAKFNLINALHPASTIAETVQLGTGVVAMAGAILNPGTSVGDNTIINTGATVDHDCVIGAHVHIAPGCNICGHVRIGDGVLVGAGSVITPMLKIGDGAVIGAGATVVRDVESGETVVGTPARSIER